jgi:nucleoside-diphosphate-sugar epimerase
VGSHLADAYLARGDEVVGLDDRSANVVDHVDGMHCIHWDARRVHYLKDRFDLVIHAASPVGAVALLERPSIVAEIVETTQAVLRYCEWTDAALINVSTSEVYGFSGVYHETDDCVIPHDLTHRIQYAAGKLAAEHLVRTGTVPAVTVRPFNVAGPRQTSSKGFVLPTFVEQALAGEPLTVFDSGFQERSFTAVWDVVDFVTAAGRALATNYRHFPDVINVGNPDNRTTVLDLAGRVLEVLGIDDGRVEFTTGKDVHGPAYEEAKGVVKVPNVKVANVLGWVPRVGLDEMIMRTADEIRQKGAVTSG